MLSYLQDENACTEGSLQVQGTFKIQISRIFLSDFTDIIWDKAFKEGAQQTKLSVDRPAASQLDEKQWFWFSSSKHHSWDSVFSLMPVREKSFTSWLFPHKEGIKRENKMFPSNFDSMIPSQVS